MIKNMDSNEYLFPHIIIDSSLNIIHSNHKFDEEFGIKENKKYELKLSDLIQEYNPEIKEQKAVIRAKCYKVFTTLVEPQDLNVSYYNVFLIENDCSLHNECELNKVAVGLIFIDNYTEVLDGVEDVKHPLLTALIDRKINSMAFNIGGIVKKLEKDKYIFIFSQDKLQYLKENKFPILDKIREIDMGNKLPVTLSIGIGINGATLNQSMEFARAAIDLALSRGGDQVLIKDIDEYSFFGGNSKEVNINTRVRARVKAFALTDLIQESSNVLIMGHKNSDLDCIGSEIGVYKIVTAIGKECNIVLNKITTSIKSFYDRLLDETDYAETAFINSDEALMKVKENTLLIIVDTYKQSICEFPDLIDRAKKIVVFDHHRKGAEFIENAVLTYHEPYASSTCELITEMFLYMNKEISLSDVEADGLLAGITVDTKNFAFKTGTKTFEAAAYLKRKGADTIRVKMLFQNSIEYYTLKAKVIEGTEMFNRNMAIAISKSNIENPPLLAAQVSDELLNIKGIEASFVLCQNENRINISARSLGKINVQIIMEKLGGGGHQTVSAAQINEHDMDKAIIMLKTAINEYLQEVK